MKLTVAGHYGRIHYTAGNPALRKTRPCYAFSPEEFFLPTGFDLRSYLISRWPSINCGANPNAIGSHAIPDPGKPVPLKTRCPILREFLRRLEPIATVKTAKPIE